MTGEKSEASIRVVRKRGELTGTDLYQVQGSGGPWYPSAAEAVDVHERVTKFWGKYYAEHHSTKRK